MNCVVLTGNLVRDPELRETGTGVAVCTFTLAVNRLYTDKQTGKREADYINVVTWRGTAELCARYLAKGRKLGVTGSLQSRSYDAQDGTRRYVTEVVADEVEFLPSGKITEARAQDGPGVASAQGGYEDDDELPF